MQYHLNALILALNNLRDHRHFFSLPEYNTNTQKENTTEVYFGIVIMVRITDCFTVLQLASSLSSECEFHVFV